MYEFFMLCLTEQFREIGGLEYMGTTGGLDQPIYLNCQVRPLKQYHSSI